MSGSSRESAASGRAPWLTAGLVLALLVGFLLEPAGSADDPMHGLGAGQTGVAWLAHVFLHGSWLHLAGSVALLVLLGFPLERAWGTPRFAVVALWAGLGAAAAFVGGGPDLGARYVGASGLCAGLIGAYAVHFWGRATQVPYGAALLFAAMVLGPPAWLGLDAAVTGRQGPGFGPSSWALLGGLVAGCLAGLVLRGSRPGPSELPARGSAARPGVQPPTREITTAAGRELLDPESPDAVRELLSLARSLGRAREAAPAVLHTVRNAARHGDDETAVSLWLELVACDGDREADAALLVRMGRLLHAAGENAAAARALRHAVLQAEEEIEPDLASHVAREAAPIDAPTAERAAWRALGSPMLDLPERQQLENLLGDLQPVLAAGRGQESPPRAHSAPPLPDTRPDPIDFDDASRSMEAVQAVPLELGEHGLLIEAHGGIKKRVRYDRIDAIALVAVEGLGPKTVLVIDLLLNWLAGAREPLKAVRLYSDRYDPRRLVPGVSDPREALVAFAAQLLRESDALPLPDRTSVQGEPFAAFDCIEKYQRNVLMVD